MQQTDLHKKIHLNSEDIRYIKNQLNQSINSRLNLDLPTNEDDSLRNQVLSYLHQYIDESFELARYSLIVDGKDITSTSLESSLTEGKQEIEPFDIELNERLRQLYAKVDEETLKVTELRRNIAQVAASKYQERSQEEQKLFQEILNSKRNDSLISSTTTSDNFTLTKSEKEILERIQSEFDHASNDLIPLQDRVPDTAAEVSKLSESIKYLQEI